MTNTDPTNTRELVYLAGLLHDEHVQSITSAQRVYQSVQEQLASNGIDWLSPLLALAKRLASGTNEAITAMASASQNRLQSVFPNLAAQTMATELYYFQAKPVTLDRSFFPAKNPAQPDQADVNRLWQSLSSSFDVHAALPATMLADSWLADLETCAVTLPCGVAQLPDVSLYDHLKSVASLSLCLFDYLTETGRLTAPTISSADNPLLLIGGDVSGIQAFIYDIIGRSAAKNLKGRSFYLQLMIDSIVQHLLVGLGLRQANVVYSSGGGFYMLAPNTPFIRDTLPVLQQEIAAQLRNEQGVSLYLAIDAEPVTEAQMVGSDTENNIGTVWAKLTEKLAAQKKRRFAQTLATTDYAYFFTPSEVGGESANSRDAITGEEFRRDPSTGKREKDYPVGPADNPDEYSQRVRKSTFDQIRLGRTLREDLQYVVKSLQPIDAWEPDDYTFGERTERHFNPLGLGQYYYFLNQKQADKFGRETKGMIDNVLVQRVNNTETAPFQLPGTNQTRGFLFYGGNSVPRSSTDNPKFFEELAGPDNLNFKRLGILRMDVDNLGYLFKNGFATGKRTFSRYATLSRSLDYFFKGYLNQIRESDPDFGDYTFILYAGGDDLFIVGKWDVTLRFAERIQTEFAAWTCHSPQLSISGGVAVVAPRFPIAKAAGQSANEEKLAKNHGFVNGSGKTIAEKSSLSLFGTALGWGDSWQHNGGPSEWQIVTELKNDLKRHISGEKNVPKSLLTKIGTLYTMQQEAVKSGQNPSWRWLSAYDLGRARERTKSKDAQAFLDQLKTDLFTNSTYKGQKLTSTNYDFLTLLNVAARWAELELRS